MERIDRTSPDVWQLDCQHRVVALSGGEEFTYCSILVESGVEKPICNQGGHIDGQPVELFREFYNSPH